MKYLLLLFLVLINVASFGQVGVNTSSPQATLDIVASNFSSPSSTDGILIPRIQQFPLINPGANQHGMLVFLTQSSGFNQPGFYFWNQTTGTWSILSQFTGGNLNDAYNFGGLGLGRTINAVNGSLRISGNDGIVSTGNFNVGEFAPSGEGVKMYWNPRKAAFRAGRVFDDRWDDVNVGSASVAFGMDTMASGSSSVAFGNLSEATGIVSTAFGGGTTASGDYSTSFGLNTIASGQSSVAFGLNSIASNFYSSAFGYYTTSSGFYSTTFGFGSEASGTTATSFGTNTIASGDNSISFGSHSTAGGSNSTAFGSDTFAEGNSATSFGFFTSALGDYSVAFGSNTLADGNSATAFGLSTTASGQNSLATGSNSSALGNNSNSSGFQNTANSFAETVIGIGATNYSISDNGATRFRTSNASDRIFVVGNAIDLNNNNQVDDDERRDAMVVLKNGNTGFGISNPSTQVHIVGENVVTSTTIPGNLHIATSDPQASNLGGSLSLGGNIGSNPSNRIFASIEGRKTSNLSLSSSGYLSFKTNNAGTLDERLRITNIGRVGIGTATPGGQFELSLDQGRKPGTNTWTIVSDARLKIVNGPYQKGLSEIIALNPVLYNYKNDEERVFQDEVLNSTYSGFLAQEVQEIFPEAVKSDEDGFLNFNIHPILIAYVNAFKELQQKNQQLETEVKYLKSTLEQIIKRLENLEMN